MKILICGYNLYGYLDSIKKAFIKAGCETSLFSHKNISTRKLKQKNPIKKIWTGLRLKHLNRSLRRHFLLFKPDMVLCINASSLFPETCDFLSRGAITVLWLVDSLERVATNMETIERFKKIFVFEPTDKEVLKEAEFLPYGFDEEIYSKQKVDKIYDVSFVGAGHRERYEPLNRLSKALENKGIRFSVFGPFSLFKKEPSFIEKYPFLYKSLAYNRRLLPEEINRIYNSSWININLHHPQSRKGVNPRTFEIAGSGNFQLVDDKEAIRNFFNQDELITCHDIDDFTEKIGCFLKEKGLISSIAEKARKRALSQHTFCHRAKEILNSI